MYGTNKPHNVAILVPNWEKLQSYAVQHAGGQVTVNSSKVRLGVGQVLWWACVHIYIY